MFLSYGLQTLIVIYTIYSFHIKDYIWVFGGVVAFILTMMPWLLKRKWSITLPWELNFLIVFSLYLHVGGSVQGWYQLFYPFYDKVGHFIGSATIAILGFTWVVVLNQYGEIKMNRPMVMLFVIVFTLALGTIWEISEFLYDRFLGTQCQPSLEDTMFDLIFDLVGGSIVGIFGNIYLSKMSPEHFVSSITNKKFSNEKESG